NSLFDSGQPSPYPLQDADAWSYLAPAGNLLAGWWLLGDRQHERFVTGRVTIPPDKFRSSVVPPEVVYRSRRSIRLSPFIAPDHFPDFETFTDVPAVATIASFPRTAAGPARIRTLGVRVLNGELKITIEAFAPAPTWGTPAPPLLDSLEVAWMVDTREPTTR